MVHMGAEPEWQWAGDRCDSNCFLLAISEGFAGEWQVKIRAKGKLVPGWEDSMTVCAKPGRENVEWAEVLKTFACV